MATYTSNYTGAQIDAALAKAASLPNVTGTLTADGLTVDTTTAVVDVVAATNDDATLFLRETGTGIVGAELTYDGGDNKFYLKVGNNSNTKRLSVDRDTGDISFYEDTGTTAKFFWDASAEYLGIGTSSPSRTLHVNSGTTDAVARFESTDSKAAIEFIDNATTSNPNIAGEGNSLTFTTVAAERMRIDSSGNVGIGTSNATPSNGEGMCIGSSDTITRIDMRNSTTGDATGDGTSLQLNGNNFTIENREAGYVAFATSLTERARIDSSGNLLIGTSTAGASKLVVNDDSIQVNTAKTPASASDTGTTGEIAWDANYVYVCVATNTWKRSALSTW